MDSMLAWRQTIPNGGAHPHGPMARSVWFYFVTSIQQVVDSMDPLDVESTLKDFLRVLKDTFHEDTRAIIPAPSPIRTFRALYKTGITPAADRDVRYLFNFDHSTRDGRTAHEDLLRFISLTSPGKVVSKVLPVSFDLDKGIPGNLKRSLRIADLRSASSLDYEGGH